MFGWVSNPAARASVWKRERSSGLRESGAFRGEADGFNSDVAANDGVDGSVDDAHGATAEFAQDFVPSGFHDGGHAASATVKWLILIDADWREGCVA